MCSSEVGAVVCRPPRHDGRPDPTHAHARSTHAHPRSSVEEVWNQTQRLMEQSEHLFRIMTHVCPHPLAGVRSSCVAQYSQGCWRRCCLDAHDAHDHAHDAHDHAHDAPPSPRHHQHPPACCEGCMGACRPQVKAWAQHHHHHHYHHHHHHHHHHEEEGAPCPCRGRGRRWRRRRGVCQCGRCEDSTTVDTWAGTALTPAHECCCPAHTTTTTAAPSSTPTPARRWRTSVPSPPSILVVFILLVAALARFTEGCSSRSTPKPRPASPTMRPNITFQTYACPPAYAAWYCLNGATCFTVKIGESILYNCECADGYMGQRCEFKDLDGSYLHTREKVLLETASIAGGATVACVLVFVVLFAVYVFMQKDKEKRCRDLDDIRAHDQQPFSGYKQRRPEIIRTITNPYARTLEELSYVEVQPSKPTCTPGEKKEGVISPSVGGTNIILPSSTPS